MYGIDMREAEKKEPNPAEDSQEKVWGCMHDKRKVYPGYRQFLTMIGKGYLRQTEF